MGTASEIVIWMVLAALVGFATGWALRSVVANRARTRLSERLEEKRRESQELREELRHLRGDDEGAALLPGATPSWDDEDDEALAHDEPEEPTLGATAEHDEVELGPLDEEEEAGGTGGTTRAMRLDEVEWEDVEDPPRTRDDEA